MGLLLIKNQTDNQLVNLAHVQDIEVVKNAVVAFNAQGNRVWLGEYCTDQKALKVLSYICAWMTSSAGPDNPIFVMPKS